MNKMIESAQDRELYARFAEYLLVSFQHFMQRCGEKERKKVETCLLEDIAGEELPDKSEDIFSQLPFEMQWENEDLRRAVQCLSERERYVVLARAVTGCTFSEIADKIHVGYKGAAAIYYRSLEKIRKEVELTQ